MVAPAAGRQSRRSSTGSAFTLPVFRRLRARGEEAFRRHGRWISRHQIRTLLLCSLVITSLFYPAVGIYFWASKGGPGVAKGDAKSVWRSLSTPFMDSFVSSGRKHVNSLSDLRMIWDDARDLRAVDARDAEAMYGAVATTHNEASAFSRPRCQSLRVEHVFVTTDDVMSGHGHRFGVLDHRILTSALQLQSLISAEANKQNDEASGPQCVLARASFPGREEGASDSTALPHCLVLSPLDFWNLDADVILADKDPAASVAHSSRNHTAFGAPLSVSTTLAGRWHLFKRLPRAEYLAFTFFLEDPDNTACKSPQQRALIAPNLPYAHDAISPSHAAWLAMLQNLTGPHVGLLPSQQNISHDLSLQFTPHRYSSGHTASQLLLFTAYLLAVVYISRNLANMRKVHSRFGLAFTGTTQLLISMIMSVSICALLGIRLSFVPWELLPFVIVVVGSENMFALTKAMIDTPISLPVSSRIAHGLSKVGVSTSLTTLADILLLSTIAVFIGVKAVREFCIFAIFSLMMDWFLQMTLFVTVLSIDMQRLELADLLTQGTRQPKKAESSEDLSNSVDDRNAKSALQHPASGNKFVSITRSLLGARTARTASLTLILVYMSGLYLYYGTGYPQHQQDSYVLADDWNTSSLSPTDASGFDPFGHLDQSQAPLPWWTSSPSADLWNSLNPLGAGELKITVEPWTILSLKSLNTAKKPPTTTSFAGWALFRPRIRAVIWFAKLVVLPISGTTGLLWMLLLYLLKDTELLDAQRDKSEGGPEGDDSSLTLSYESQTSARVSLLANAHQSDIEFLSQDQNLVATVDTTGLLQLRKMGDKLTMEASGSAINVSDLGQGVATRRGPVTALTLSSSAGWTVLGFASGSVCFVKTTDGFQLLWEAAPSSNAAPVVRLALQRQNASSAAVIYSALSYHSDGSIYVWSQAQKQVLRCSDVNGSLGSPSSSHWRCFPVTYVRAKSDERCSNTSLVGFASSDAQFDLRKVNGADASFETIFRTPDDQRGHVRCALLCDMKSKASNPEATQSDKILLLGYADGTLRQFAAESGEMVNTLHLDDGPVCDIKVAEGEDASVLFVVQTASRVSLVVVSRGDLAAEATNGHALGLSIRIRTPNGSITTAASFWAGNSAPPSPSSEMGNLLSYPMSSHGSASRLRRTSAYTRDRSSSSATISETVNLDANGTIQTVANAGPTPIIRLDDQQMRLLGWLRCQRGGSYVGEHGSCLVGVSRSKRTDFMETSNDAEGAGSSKWEYWILNLREELVMGRGGELMASRFPLILNAPPHGPATSGHHSGPQSRIRFIDSNSAGGALAFTRLQPIVGQTKGFKTSLLFGYGGSIGVIQHRSD